MNYKKLCQLSIIASLLSVNVMANDQKIIIGAGGGASSLKRKGVSTNETSTNSGTAIHLKIGTEKYVQSNQAIRAYIDGLYEGYSKMGYLTDVDYTSLGANIEYRIDLIPKKIGLFIGPRIYYSMGHGEYQEPNSNKIHYYDSNTIGVGAGLGLLLTPAPFFELEFKANIPGFHGKNELKNFGPYASYEIGMPYSAQFGLNFKF